MFVNSAESIYHDLNVLSLQTGFIEGERNIHLYISNKHESQSQLLELTQLLFPLSSYESVAVITYPTPIDSQSDVEHFDSQI